MPQSTANNEAVGEAQVPGIICSSPEVYAEPAPNVIPRFSRHPRPSLFRCCRRPHSDCHVTVESGDHLGTVRIQVPHGFTSL